MLGGKLGRHPALAEELQGIFSSDDVLKFLDLCLEHYFRHSTHGERFGEILERVPIEYFEK